MPSLNNNHRIDQVTRQNHNHSYIVPCGMNTIKYLSKCRPTRKDLLTLTSNLPSGQALLISYFDGKDFIISSIINSMHDAENL